MTAKLTIIYANPTNPEEFETSYAEHKQLINKLPDLQRAEYGKVFPKEDGSPTPKWRTADLYFANYDTAVKALGSEQGRALAQETLALATTGVEFLLSTVE